MTKFIITAGILLLTFSFQLQAQVTQDNNIPLATNWVGFDVNSGIVLPIENRGFPGINISSNTHNKFRITELPTWNGLNFLSRDDVQRTTMGLQGETNTAWSLLHLWSGDLTGSMQRDYLPSESLFEDSEDQINTAHTNCL